MAFFAIFPAKVINKFASHRKSKLPKDGRLKSIATRCFFCGVAVSIAGGYTFSFIQIFWIWPSPMMGAWAS